MITFDIVDDTQIDSGTVFITGHGIPGTTPPGGSPTTLSVLGAQGSFVRAASVISRAACSGGTATITTSVAIQVAVNDRVFVSGVAEAGYNGVFKVTAVKSNTEFAYQATSGLPDSSGGAVYLPELINSQTITTASGLSGIVTVTLQGSVDIPLNSPIFLAGLTGAGAGWNGVRSVSQNPSSNPALTSKQFQISLKDASGDAGTSNSSTVDIVALSPVRLTALPTNPDTHNPCLSLDENIAECSAQLVAMVTPADMTPTPLGIVPGTANLSNLGNPPFAVGQQAGNSVVDIVEFYYAGDSGHSTFDVSQVDGFALPLTLKASRVLSGPDQVGVDPSLPTLSRERIGDAFAAFIASEPDDVRTSGQFGRLLYNGPVSTNPLPVSGPSTQGPVLTNVQLDLLQRLSSVVKATASAAHGLVPGQRIKVTGAGAPYDGTFSVAATGLTDGSLSKTQFTYVASTSPDSASSGSVAPTNSGVIATGATNLVVEVTSGTVPSPGATVQLSGVPDGTFSGSVDEPYTVLPIHSNAGLSGNAAFLATTTGQTFTIGSSSGGGTLGTPLFAAPPKVPRDQFYVIAAPKDWLANQPVGTANSDPMARWWDDAVDAFFKEGNYLQVAISTDLSYTGKYNATAKSFDFYTNLKMDGKAAFHIAKPRPGGGQHQSLANAAWVWAQSGIPSSDRGTVWDQIVQAFCRGVAMDGILTSKPTASGLSNAAWTETSNWYKQPNGETTSRYCPFSKFLHYGTLSGGTNRTGSGSIYLEQLAYGFSEDETPIGSDGNAISTAAPSKMDGTVPEGITMSLTIGRFPIAVRAQGMAVMVSGIVQQVVITNPGSRYTSPPTVTIQPPASGTQATAVAVVSPGPDGQVTKVTMTDQGSGYSSGPQVTFSNPVET